MSVSLPPRRTAVTLLAVAVAYIAGGKLGLELGRSSVDGAVSPVWPSAGVALAALLILGYRVWPAIAAGGTIVTASAGVPVLVAGAIGLGNAVSAVLAATLLQRVVRLRPTLEGVRDLIGLLVLGAAVPAAAGASIGILSLWAGGVADADLWHLWRVWWLGDTTGALVVTPFVLACVGRPPKRREAVELTALATVTATLASIVFNGALADAIGHGAVVYLLFPLAVWSGLRLGRRGAATAALIIAATGVWYTVEGRGPFADADVLRSLALLDGFIMAFTVTGLALATLDAGRRTIAAQRTALRRQNELLLASAGEGIVALDRDGRITLANPAAQAILGYREAELLGQDAHALLHHSYADGTPYPLAECPINGALTRVIVERDDETFWRKDGSAVPVAYTATPVVEGGEVVGMIAVFRDIGERRRLEAQLRQAQKMEAVGQLAGGIAHDFNNLLTAIRGYGDLALRHVGSDPAAARAALSSASEATARAAGLTRQLLAFSRKQLLQPLVLDVNEVVLDAHKLMTRLLGGNIDVTTRLDPDVARVRADRGQLDQVLVNLAVNARDAMPAGGTLTIETANVELAAGVDLPAGRYVSVSVADTGTGIAPEVRDHIFEPFFTTKDVDSGTGLGLATVYGIVKQSGGDVVVESEPGAGARFTVYLPACDDLPVAGRVEAATEAPRGAERILLVEDEPLVRELVTEMLDGQGYQVAAAAGPEEALALRDEAAACDLLITDVVMPKLDGRTLAARLRQARPDLRVLYTSGYTSDVVVDDVAAGSAFLQKPFSLDELAATVRDILDRAA
jgi:PAS domain S-box-containing protein